MRTPPLPVPTISPPPLALHRALTLAPTASLLPAISSASLRVDGALHVHTAPSAPPETAARPTASHITVRTEPRWAVGTCEIRCPFRPKRKISPFEPADLGLGVQGMGVYGLGVEDWGF